MNKIDKNLATKIDQICQEGNALIREGRLDDAWRRFASALSLIPEDKTKYSETTWVVSAIGDVLFMKRMFAESRDAFEDAVRCPGGLGNVFIHMRLGECHFELGDQRRASDELTRAYLGGGREAFSKEDPKYFQLLERVLKTPKGQDKL